LPDGYNVVQNIPEKINPLSKVHAVTDDRRRSYVWLISSNRYYTVAIATAPPFLDTAFEYSIRETKCSDVSALEMSYDNALYKSILHYITLHSVRLRKLNTP